MNFHFNDFISCLPKIDSLISHFHSFQFNINLQVSLNELMNKRNADGCCDFAAVVLLFSDMKKNNNITLLPRNKRPKLAALTLGLLLLCVPVVNAEADEDDFSVMFQEPEAKVVNYDNEVGDREFFAFHGCKELCKLTETGSAVSTLECTVISYTLCASR